MEQLLGYIKNIGFFLILMSVVCNVLPDNGYKKYCRLFCGLVLVVLVINPFYEFLNYNGDIKDIFISNTYKSQFLELQNQLELQADTLDSDIKNQYEEALKNELSGLATEAGLYLTDVSVETVQTEETGELSLKNLTLYVTDNKERANNMQEGMETTDGKLVKDNHIVIDDIKINNNNSESQDTDYSDIDSNPGTIQLIMKVADYLKIQENQVYVKMV